MARPRLSPEQLAQRLEQCRDDYEAAKAAVAEVGFICEGSLTEVYHCCRKPNCRCADPAQRHGPYWQLTWKEAGKTVTRRLSEQQARLYQESISNRRRMESVIRQMQDVSREAAGYLLAEIGQPFQGPQRPRRQSRSGRRGQA